MQRNLSAQTAGACWEKADEEREWQSTLSQDILSPDVSHRFEICDLAAAPASGSCLPPNKRDWRDFVYSRLHSGRLGCELWRRQGLIFAFELFFFVFGSLLFVSDSLFLHFRFAVFRFRLALFRCRLALSSVSIRLCVRLVLPATSSFSLSIHSVLLSICFRNMMGVIAIYDVVIVYMICA